jgi:hypothetical protein
MTRILTSLAIIKKAAADSARLRDLIEKDPYYQDTLLASKSWPFGCSVERIWMGPVKSEEPVEVFPDRSDDPDQQVHAKKLKELDKVLSQTSHPKFDSKIRPASQRRQENR